MDGLVTRWTGPVAWTFTVAAEHSSRMPARPQTSTPWDQGRSLVTITIPRESPPEVGDLTR